MNSIFIHIPKTGGLTIEAALKLKSIRHRARFKNAVARDGSIIGNVSFGHMDYHKLLRDRDYSPYIDKSAFKYAFCRNPYDRAVSHWKYCMKKHPSIIPQDTPFLEFTRLISRPDKRKHFREQYLYVNDITIDFQGRFENFLEDLSKIADMIGVNLQSIPHENSTKHKPYFAYYCEESKQNILNFYRKDFEYFGYDINDYLLYR